MCCKARSKDRRRRQIQLHGPTSQLIGLVQRRIHECTDNRPHDFVLDREDLGNLAIEPFGPYMIAGLGIDQLSRDSNPLAKSANTALDDVANVQVTCDLPEVGGGAPVAEGRRARPDRQFVPSRQVSDYVLGEPVAEIALRRIAAEVGERQHGNRRLGSRALGGRVYGGQRGSGAYAVNSYWFCYVFQALFTKVIES